MINIRPYQQSAIDDIASAATKGHRRILLQVPTGGGKTIIAARIVNHSISNGMKVLFLAHRRELIFQCENKMRDLGMDAGIIMSDEPHDPTLPLQIASIQTLHRRAIKRSAMTVPKADLVVVDECHLATAKTWDDVLKKYPEAFILGLSATPIRQSGKGLGHAFDTLIHGPTISELTKDGWLVPMRYFCPTLPDLQGLKVKNGDYVEGELEKRLDKIELIGDIVKNWTAICPTRKTIVFASGIKHSIHIAENFNAIGIKAKHIDGDTPQMERDQVIKEFEAGDIQVLSNVGVYCEGTDIPCASALVFARPTKSLRLYLQVAGRVLRPSEGKKDCIMLDHAGVTYEHGMIDQQWDWQLDYSDGTVNSMSQKKRDKKKEITCANCKCVYRGMLDCPECHTRPKVNGKPVDTLDAYLQELTESERAKDVTADKSIWWRGFVWDALQGSNPKLSRDGLPSAAYARFQEKFKSWPHHSYKKLEPIEPPLDVKAWIKHSKIKYAMSQKKKNPQRTWNWKQPEVKSHGYARIDAMAANAYTPEIEETSF